jgi:hypothetical protein
MGTSSFILKQKSLEFHQQHCLKFWLYQVLIPKETNLNMILDKIICELCSSYQSKFVTFLKKMVKYSLGC